MECVSAAASSGDRHVPSVFVQLRFIYLKEFGIWFITIGYYVSCVCF